MEGIWRFVIQLKTEPPHDTIVSFGHVSENLKSIYIRVACTSVPIVALSLGSDTILYACQQRNWQMGCVCRMGFYLTVQKMNNGASREMYAPESVC